MLKVNEVDCGVEARLALGEQAEFVIISAEGHAEPSANKADKTGNALPRTDFDMDSTSWNDTGQVLPLPWS